MGELPVLLYKYPLITSSLKSTNGSKKSEHPMCVLYLGEIVYHNKVTHKVKFDFYLKIIFYYYLIIYY